MTGQPPGGNVGVNLYGIGDIDMWTGPTSAVGHTVAGIGRDLSSEVPALLAKIAACHESISANISEWDEVSATYMEQENAGLPEFTKAVNGLPSRLGEDADACFAAIDYYVANDGDMARRMGAVTDSPSGPESRA